MKPGPVDSAAASIPTASFLETAPQERTREGPRGGRLQIDHLELDLRGVNPQTAQAALEALGPALARAMRGRGLKGTSAARLDGGTIPLDHPADAATLAGRLAQRLAERLTGDEP
ncbi:MAG: hypothetical protein ER33_04980 [Cyanobium sp. CACIAM 14]|nr:MAG: hypothetical protein ER33_04980 [Cyanobium sp. CACIAM 14]